METQIDILKKKSEKKYLLTRYLLKKMKCTFESSKSHYRIERYFTMCKKFAIFFILT